MYVCTDQDLLPLLSLSREYQMDSIRLKCEAYMGLQVETIHRHADIEYNTNQRHTDREYNTNQSNSAAQQAFVFGPPSRGLHFTQYQSPRLSTGRGRNKEPQAPPEVEKLLLYLFASDEHQLLKHRDMIISLLARVSSTLLKQCKNVKLFPSHGLASAYGLRLKYCGMDYEESAQTLNQPFW